MDEHLPQSGWAPIGNFMLAIDPDGVLVWNHILGNQPWKVFELDALKKKLQRVLSSLGRFMKKKGF